MLACRDERFAAMWLKECAALLLWCGTSLRTRVVRNIHGFNALFYTETYYYKVEDRDSTLIDAGDEYTKLQ